MCVEDWKFGRFIRTEAVPVTVTTTPTELLGADPSRVFIRFSVNVTTSVNFYLDNNLASSRFLTVEDRSPQAVLRMTEDGDVVTRRILAAAGSGSVIVFMLVGYLPERVLRMSMEQMKEIGVG